MNSSLESLETSIKAGDKEDNINSSSSLNCRLFMAFVWLNSFNRMELLSFTRLEFFRFRLRFASDELLLLNLL